MQFKKLIIKNFMSVGNDPVIIDFEKYKNNGIVVIEGHNDDVSNTSSNGAGKCVDESTIVEIKRDLNQNSEKITVGEIVDLYRDDKNKVYVKSFNNRYCLIEKAAETYYGPYYTIKNSNNDILMCSPDHILYHKNKKEVKCKDVQVGDFLITCNGSYEIIEKLYSEESKVLYDFQVADTHLYYTNNYLSHNSMIYEALVYVLFDETIREISKKDLHVNNINKRNMEVQLDFDDMRIVRGRKPLKLAFYKDSECKFDKSEHDLTKSTPTETQKLIEDYFKFSLETVVNVVCVGQHNLYNFLSAPKATKRTITENMLQLSQYNEYEKESRKQLSDLKKEISNTEEQYSNKLKDKSINEIEINSYINKKDSYTNEINLSINSLKAEQKKINDIDWKEVLNQWKKYEENKSLKETHSLDIIKLKEELNTINSGQNEEIAKIDSEIKSLKEVYALDAFKLKEELSSINFEQNQELMKSNSNIASLKEKYSLDIIKLKEQLNTVDSEQNTEISKIDSEIKSLKEKYSSDIFKVKEELNTISSGQNKEIAKIDSEINSISSQIENIKQDISKISKMEAGVRCNSCYQIVDPNNYDNLIKEFQESYIELKNKLKEPENKKKEVIEKYDNDKLTLNNKIKELNDKINQLTIKETEDKKQVIEKYDSSRLDLNGKIDTLNNQINILNNTELEDKQKIIKKYDKNKSDLNNRIQELSDKLIDELKEPENKKKKVIEKYDNDKLNLNNKIEELNNKINELNLREPSISKKDISEYQISAKNLENQIKEKEKSLENNPYVEIVNKLQIKIDEIKNELKHLNTEIEQKKGLIPYYNFWTKGFGETGIKSFVVDQIIPILNQQINYWLQFFIDNKIIVNFDKFLDVEIKREGQDANLEYEQGSGGERRRIDLAISLAFSYIMRLRAGIHSNIIFLDELAESIDSQGIEGIYNALLELSKDKTAFVITHRSDLLDKLKNRPKIELHRNNGFTTIYEQV